ncbi:MAG: metalloregulator ArsR/SmtB family transcription factor [Pseudomonadota bacterium]
MNESQVIEALGALAQETRLRMLRYLVTRGGEGAAAGEVAEAVGAASSRASFHLSALASAGLITAERASRQIIYRVEFGAMAALAGYLVQDCCQGDARVVACCQTPDCC